MSTATAPCRRVPCDCGECYQPRSVVGGWLGDRLRCLLRRAHARLIGLPARYGTRGEVLVPEWVVRAFEDER